MSNEATKNSVLAQIANGQPVSVALGKGRAKWQVGAHVVHVRFRTSPKSDGVTFAYNINPNSLTADYELWICGSESVYYLIPNVEIRAIYDDPDTYPDFQHPEIRVADIDTLHHRALYGRGGKSRDFTQYFCRTV